MYHPPCDRSEFYSMSDLTKPPILVTLEDDDSNGPELTLCTIATAGASEENAAAGEENAAKTIGGIRIVPLPKKDKIFPEDRELTALSCEGSPVLLYVKKADEEIFHPLHIVPPTLVGLAIALEKKYSIAADQMRHFYKKCKKGITIVMDDDIIRLYSNEDTFILDIKTEGNQFDITLIEL